MFITDNQNININSIQTKEEAFNLILNSLDKLIEYINENDINNKDIINEIEVNILFLKRFYEKLERITSIELLNNLRINCLKK